PSQNRREDRDSSPRRRRGRASSDARREPSGRDRVYVDLLPAVESPLELGLRHPRAPRDVPAPGLVVELFLRPPLRPVRPGAKPTSTTGGHVARRRARGASLRLAGAGALLVDGTRGDFLGAFRRAALLLLRLLDVLVLALALRAPC